MVRAAVVGLENNERIVRDRIGGIAVAIGIFERGEDVAEVSIETRDHCGPLPGLR